MISPMLFSWRKYNLWIAIALGLTLCLVSKSVLCDRDDGSINEDLGAFDKNNIESQTQGDKPSADVKISESVKAKSYHSPNINSDDVFIFESFDDPNAFKVNWIQSEDSKYNGRWILNSGSDRPPADLQLVLPRKAHHYGISSKLAKPFKFSDDKPLVVQYEVQFREGLDCGGAYVKLLRNSAINDLSKLTDKTPFTIMFGPDKCGSEAKLHFIVQYLNPKTQEYTEKHWKQSKYVSNLMATFSDRKYHLFKFLLEPSNRFELFLDDKSVGSGNLLEDMDPPINPPKEITDPNDKKPEDWDERAQIDDPDAKKPDDWDEDAPMYIEDPNATKPDDWLEDEPIYIPDSSATKPDDWEEMDGEWEAPKIQNPACEKVSGCGPWKAPQITNPAHKGKWKPPQIANPKYKGKWAPRMIQNPDYFYDEKPFSSLEPIGAIAFELWSMADNVVFDNLIITNNPESANLVQSLTWQSKKAEADASSPSLLTRAIHYFNLQPWLWSSVIALVIALLLWLFISYCCDTKKTGGQSTQAASRRKKTDESRPDDEASTSPKDTIKEDLDEDDKNSSSGEDDEDEEDEKSAEDATPSKRQVRQRKVK